MESYGIEEARNQLGDLVERVRISGEHIALTRYGKAAVVLVPAVWREEMQDLCKEAAGRGAA